MTLRKSLSAVFAGTGILFLILDARTALAGAAAGTDLCIRTVIPSLFPFLFLCSLLTESMQGMELPFMRYPCRLLGIPEGSQSILSVALLGGYPAGAAAVADVYRQGNLSQTDACRLLTFCSNAGPAFLFGMTARQFPEKGWILAVWTVLILSAFLTGRIFSGKDPACKTVCPGHRCSSGILERSVRTIAVICGWVILFRILTEFLDRWIAWYFSPELRVFLTGLLELSNGCCSLSTIPDIRMRFLVCTVIHACGGICVAMQTASVISGLPIKPYLTGKLIQSVISFVLSVLFLRFGWWAMAFTAACVFLFPPESKKAVAFRKISVYNADITTGRAVYAVSKKN